jgi:tetratricopeptide (TPR) repeat protein
VILRILLLSCFCMIALLPAGCGDDGDGPGPVTSAESLTADGWRLFEAASFAAALDRFDAALETDPVWGEAYNGLGWTWMNLDSLEAAVDAFERAMGKNVETPADPLAGMAAARRDLEPVDLELCLTAADSALSLSPRYVFSHDPSYDWRDVRLILAHAHFGLGQYAEASAQVDNLGGIPQDPGSDTFVEDLMEEIQRLGEVFSR